MPAKYLQRLALMNDQRLCVALPLAVVELLALISQTLRSDKVPFRKTPSPLSAALGHLAVEWCSSYRLGVVLAGATVALIDATRETSAQR